jgi:hypothetical protein
MENFKAVVGKLVAAKVPCRVRLTTDNSVIVELGFNYPEEMAFQVWDVAGDEVEVCAEVSTEFLATAVVAGGPKRHFNAFRYAGW